MNSEAVQKARDENARVPDEERVYRWTKALERIPDRSAGTPGERKAAEQVETWLRELGDGEVGTEPFKAPSRCTRSGYLLALHAGMASAGCFLGGWAGALLVGMVAWSISGTRWFNLAHILPDIASVNAVGRFGPATASRRIVLSAHIDTAQAGLLFHPRLTNAFATGSKKRAGKDRPPAGPSRIPYLLAMAAFVVVLVSLAGPGGWFVDLVGWGMGAVLGVVSLLGLQWGFSRATPGANDNASAVAAMLLCGERLLPALPPDTELYLVACGAEEVGSRGMAAFMDRQPWRPECCFCVNFESVGSSHLHYALNEGANKKLRYPQAALALARRIAEGGEYGEITPTELMIGTDGRVPVRRGFPALSLVSLEANSVPRNYHRPEDVTEALDMSTVVRAAEFAAAVSLAALADGVASPE